MNYPASPECKIFVYPHTSPHYCTRSHPTTVPNLILISVPVLVPIPVYNILLKFKRNNVFIFLPLLTHVEIEF